MIEDYSPLTQTLLGTLFTWAVTAAGSACVFFLSGSQRILLDCSLGFAAGVMLAASYWSLLEPAIQIGKECGHYGASGEYVFIPVSIGFFLGALFVASADYLMPDIDFVPALTKKNDDLTDPEDHGGASSETGSIRRRQTQKMSPSESRKGDSEQSPSEIALRWRRMWLMIIAVTVHNIPEGLAVGVGFSAVGQTNSTTFQGARNIAFGIGIQNFPEGLAVSLPLRAAGMSPWKAFFWGQLSGMVEPIAGLLGCMALIFVQTMLPLALAFAAGAMIFVVLDDIVPETHSSGNKNSALWCSILGFIVMMSLDVCLG